MTTMLTLRVVVPGSKTSSPLLAVKSVPATAVPPESDHGTRTVTVVASDRMTGIATTKVPALPSVTEASPTLTVGTTGSAGDAAGAASGEAAVVRKAGSSVCTLTEVKAAEPPRTARPRRPSTTPAL